MVSYRLTEMMGASMADTSATPEPVDTNVQSARNWIDSVTARNQWRLQILSKRYRKNAAGEMVELPLRIRRFVEGCPASALKPALDYLLSLAPYTGIVFNGQSIDGEYLPTLTRWSRDDQEVVSSVKARTDGTYTLIQDLIDRRYADEYEFLSQSSCSSEATATYVWDAAQIEDVPACGSCVGMSYSIQAVSRNEDGTFDYALIARKALTQHLPETVTEDSAVRRVTTESWDNVYPGPTDGTYLDHAGNALDIPAPGISGGVETKVTNLGMNEDCTLRIQVAKETTKSVGIRTQSRHTIFQGDHEDDASGAPIPLPVAPEAHGGIVPSHESQLQPDGTFVNKTSQRIERAVPHAVVEVKVGFKGRRVTTTNRHQAAPADTSGIAIGGSVRVERTEGDLYDNTVSTWDRTDPLRSGERCEEDLFSHRDTTITSGVAEIPSDHVSGGANGRTVSRRTDMDEEGAIIQTTEVGQERNVDNADEEWSVSVDGVMHKVVHRNRDLVNKGVAPAFSPSNVGKTVRNERTPGGLVTVTVSELDRNTGSLRTSAECTQTIFEHVDSNSVTDPAGTIPVASHASAAGAGKTYDKQMRLNANGAVVTVERTTTENQVDDAQLSYRRTVRGLILSRTTRNGQVPATDPQTVGCSRSHEKTPGGRFNLTDVTITAAASPDSAHCRKTWFEHEHDTVTMSTGSVDSSELADAGNGIHRIKNSDLDSDGFVKTVVRSVNEIQRLKADASYRRTPRGLITTTVDRNISTPATDPGVGHVGESQSHTSTEGGRFNLTKTVITANLVADSAYCAKNAFEHVHDTVSMSTGAVDAADILDSTIGGGKYAVKTSDLDSDGFAKTVVRMTQEKNQPTAEKTYRRTVRGLITTTVERNGSTPASDPGSGHPGESRSHRMTPGGLYDLTTVEVDASDAAPDSAYCAKTVFEHVHDEVEMSTGGVNNSEVAEAGGGFHRVKTSDLDSDGFVKTVTRTTEEKEQTNAEASIRRTVRGLVKSVTDRNTTSTVPNDVAIGCSASHRLTPGGRYDYTSTTIEASRDPDSAYCAKTIFEHVHDQVTMSDDGVDQSVDASAGDGSHQVITQDMDSDGFVKKVVRTTTELQVSAAEEEYESDHFTKTHRVTGRNETYTQPNESSYDFAGDNAEEIKRVVVQKTPGGRAVKTETTIKPKYRHWDHEVDMDYQYSKTVWFVNAESSDKDSLFDNAKSAFESKLNSWISGNRSPSNHGCTPEVTLNKYGRFDGKFSFYATWHPESAGGKSIAIDRYFWYKDYQQVSETYNPETVGEKAYIRKTRIEQQIYIESGRGSNRFMSLIGSAALFHFSASMDPITQVFHVTKTTSQNVTITYDEQTTDTSDFHSD